MIPGNRGKTQRPLACRARMQPVCQAVLARCRSMIAALSITTSSTRALAGPETADRADARAREPLGEAGQGLLHSRCCKSSSFLGSLVLPRTHGTLPDPDSAPDQLNHPRKPLNLG